MAEIIGFPGNNNKEPIVAETEGKVGSCQPSTAEIIQRGQAVLSRLECNLTWETEWRDLILAHGVGRDIALRAAETKEPQGPKYRAAMGTWLRCYGFDRIDKADRSRLLLCFDNLTAINAWRAALPVEKWKALNHPRTVLAHWNRSLRSTPPDERNTKPPVPPPITINMVLSWLATASLEDKRRVAAVLAADVQAMKRILPGKQLPARATDKQIYEKAMGLTSADIADGAPAH